MTSRSTPQRAALCACAAFIAASTPQLLAATVNTAFGDGADLQIAEGTDGIGIIRNNDRLYPRGDRNQIVAIKIDLSGYLLSTIENAAFNVFPNRTGESGRLISLYGVHDGATAPEGGLTTETWTESGVTKWNEMPGLLATDSDVTTLSFDLDNLTLLVDKMEGPLTTADVALSIVDPVSGNANLNAFLQGYTGSSVTFLLITAENEARYRSKEAAADPAGALAPFLSFDATPVPEPTSLALTGLGGGGVVAPPPQLTMDSDCTGRPLPGGPLLPSLRRH